MEKIVNCKKCGEAIVVSGPNDGTREQSTNLECPDPKCKHPNEVTWPTGTSFTKRLK